MPTQKAPQAKKTPVNHSKGLLNVKRVVESVINLYRRIRPKPEYDKLSDENKKIFDNLHPELSAHNKLVDKLTDISMTLGGIFGSIYIGIELSNLLGLIAITSVASVVAFAFLVASFVIYFVSSIYQMFYLDRQRDAILKNEGLKHAFNDIKNIHDTVKGLQTQLAPLVEYYGSMADFGQLASDPKGQDKLKVAMACRKYLDYANRILDKDSLEVVIDNILAYRDHNDRNSAEMQKKKQIDEATEWTDYLLKTVKFDSPEKTLDLDTVPGVNDEFMRRWTILVDGRPDQQFKSGDAHQVFFEYLEEISEISQAVSLLEAIKITMQDERDISHLADVLYRATEQALKQHGRTPVVETPNFDPEQLASKNRSSRLLRQPLVDVPRIVADMYVEDPAGTIDEPIAKKSISPRNEPLPYMPTFIRWLHQGRK